MVGRFSADGESGGAKDSGSYAVIAVQLGPNLSALSRAVEAVFQAHWVSDAKRL